MIASNWRDPGRRQQRRKNPPGLLVLAPFPDPETTLHGRDACACFHSTTRLAQMGLRGQEITCCIRCEGTSSIAHCHCPPNGRTRPPVRRRWRGGAGEGCSASSIQLPCPPFSRRGPRNTYSRTEAPNSAITVFTTYSDLGSMAPCGLPWERVERREQMTTLVHHNGETTTTTTTLSGWSWLQLGAWLPGRRRPPRCRWT